VSGAGYEPVGTFAWNGSAAEPSPTLTTLLRGAVLASDARLVQVDGHWAIKGDPTEGALVVAAAKANLIKSRLDIQFPRVDEVPFTSETKRMTTLHTTPDGMMAYSKGAPDILEALVTYPEVRSRLAAVVSAAGAVGGTLSWFLLAGDTVSEGGVTVGWRPHLHPSAHTFADS